MQKRTNPKTKEWMLAVFNVVEGDETIPMIARLFHKSYNSIKNWIARFKKLGTVGLHEEPRSGRPTKLVNHKITEFFAGVKNGIFPKQLVRQIKKDTGVNGADPSIMRPIKSVYFLEQEVRGRV